MEQRIINMLKYPFQFSEIKWRPVGGGLIAPYVDSREIQERLDNVVGPDHWASKHELGGKTYICKLSILDTERNEWVSKSDGAGETQIEGEKGGCSDSFKRAASMWGIARYLYALAPVKAKLVNKRIADSEWPAIAQHYNNQVSIWLNQHPEVAAIGNQQQPVKQPVPQQVQPTVQNQQIQQAAKETPDIYLVTNAAPDDNGLFTLVRLQDRSGQVADAYVLGENQLAPGHKVRNIQISPKVDENNQPYNILEQYELAA